MSTRTKKPFEFDETYCVIGDVSLIAKLLVDGEFTKISMIWLLCPTIVYKLPPAKKPSDKK